MYLFQKIRQFYGKTGVCNVRKFIHLTKRLAVTKAQITFLTRCLHHNILPRHLANSRNISLQVIPECNKMVELRMKKIQIQYNRNILKLEHQVMHFQCQILYEKVERFKIFFVEHYLPCLTFQILQMAYFTFQNYLTHNNLRLKVKFQNLVNIQFHQNLEFPEKWLVNLTNIDIEQGVKWFLALGPKFVIQPQLSIKKIPNITSHMDHITSIISNESDRNQVKSALIISLTHWVNNHKTIKKSPILNKFIFWSFKTKTFLKQNSDIIVTMSDKGNTTVLIKKDDYKGKMMQILSDTSTYNIVSQKNPIHKLQTSLNSLLKELQNRGELQSTEYKKLSCRNEVIAKIYGLIKIHKINHPLRPIVSSCGYPSYEVATFLANLLDPLKDPNINVKNSYCFKQEISSLNIPMGYQFFSLDVVNMYPNIPLDICLELIQNQWQQISHTTKLSFSSFKQLFLLCNNNNFLQFQNIIYKQNFGLAMGSPLSPILSNIVMDHLVNTQISLFISPPLVVKKYVDDLFMIAQEDQLTEIINIFNSYHERIQFTIELPKNNSLPYLDLLIVKQDSQLTFDLYQKPTASGRYINYYSAHNLKFKINLLKNLRYRIINLCDPQFREKWFQNFADTLLLNGYPSFFINKHLLSDSQNIIVHNKQNSPRFSFPFYPNIFFKLQRLLKPHNIMLVPNFQTTIGKLFYSKFKDNLPEEVSSNVVYSIPCENCNKNYIGHTSQYLKERMSQHKRSLRDMEVKSGLVQHVRSEGHTFNFKQCKILYHEQNYFRRTFLETMSIKTLENVNLVKDFKEISSNYNVLFSSIKKP